ncbi:chorismate-binding protein [Bizionia sp. KMM 8389]
MIFVDFLSQLQTQLDNNMPFVAYRNPGELQISSLLQINDTIFKTDDFSESGYVFAPFDLNNESILIPSDQALSISSEINEDVDLENYTNILKSDSSVTEFSSEKKHINLVAKGVEKIEGGFFKKVVLSREEVLDLADADALAIFMSLIKTYPLAYVYIWFHPKVGMWLGATPETLLNIENKQCKTMALAGTQIYNGKVDVTWGEKELEEQDIVTKFIVSSLENKLDGLKTSAVKTMRAGNLLHLNTQITGRLNQTDSSLKEIIKSLHPTPAVCGLPKAEAKKFILENENYNRAFYTGFLGELNMKKVTSRNTNRRNVENSAYASIKTVSNLFVNLRCMQLMGNQAHLYIGGGITKDSCPSSEWEETVAKSLTMKKVLQ